MRSQAGKVLVWALAAVIAGTALWWFLRQPRPSEPARTDPAAAQSRQAPARTQTPEGTTQAPPQTSLAAPSETDRRRSGAPPRAVLSARRDAALNRLREGGGVRETQGAFLALTHPYTSEAHLRDGLAILGGRSDQLQREVFQALRTRLRPEVRQALEKLAAHDPSPQVRRAAGLALEVVEERNPDSGR